MPKEKLKKGEITRQTIEDAAIELFMEQGYHATSMRQIAKRAGISLGGTGLQSQPGTITVTVPAGANVAQVLLYWGG